jgi:hypothetical protein
MHETWSWHAYRSALGFLWKNSCDSLSIGRKRVRDGSCNIRTGRRPRLPNPCVIPLDFAVGRKQPCVVWGPVDGRFLVWWVIDNVVWTNSWLSIAGTCCGLTGVGAGEEQAQKAIAGEASRCGEDKLAWFEGPHGQRGQVRAAWWQEQDEVDGRFLGWASKPRSSRDFVGAEPWVVIGGGYIKFAGFAVVHQKTTRLLGWATKPRPKTGRGCQAITGLTGWWNRSDRFGVAGRREASKRRTRVGIARLASRLREVWSLSICSMVLRRQSPKVPLVGVYPSLCNRGSLVFWLASI